MNQTIKDLLERRSIRKYKDEQITDEELNTILKVGTYAPSSAGRQPNLIVVLQNKEDIEEYKALNAKHSSTPDRDPFYGAPTVLIVFSDGNYDNYLKDGSAVLTNLVNGAHAIGVGSCWIDRADKVFDSDEGKALMKKWGVDEKYRGVGNCILGHRDGELPEAKERKDDYILKI